MRTKHETWEDDDAQLDDSIPHLKDAGAQHADVADAAVDDSLPLLDDKRRDTIGNRPDLVYDAVSAGPTSIDGRTFASPSSSLSLSDCPTGAPHLLHTSPHSTMGHQRMDTCRCPLGASQQKNSL